jgi:hypothetical protein
VRRPSRCLFINMIVCGVTANILRILPVSGLKACMYSSTAKTTVRRQEASIRIAADLRVRLGPSAGSPCFDYAIHFRSLGIRL